MNTTMHPAPTVHERPVRPEPSVGPGSTPTLTSPVHRRHGGAGSTLCEMGALIRTRPSLASPALEVADWYERKAALLHRIATETGDTDAEQCAHAAHIHAMTLCVGGAA
jgi:hypothetical protein